MSYNHKSVCDMRTRQRATAEREKRQAQHIKDHGVAMPVVPHTLKSLADKLKEII